ncbi:MAG: glycosyltransferase [Chloroflexota bacterium]
MHVLLLAFGSRGDVQPILALAGGLQSAGYAVSIGAGINFKDWIEGAGFRYAPFSTDMHALMQSEAGRRWIEQSSRNPIAGLKFMRQMMDDVSDDTNAELLAACEDADVIVSGLPVFPMAAAIAEKYGKPHIRTMFVPMKPTRYPELSIFPYSPKRPSFLNVVAGYVGINFLWSVPKQATNELRERLGLKKWGYWGYARAWNQTPTLYGLSTHTVPPADDWPGENAVTGYWFWDDHGEWQPSPELLAFLESGPPPVYVGFGSMSSSDPAGTLKIVVDALEKSGQRGIVYRGWADMSADDLPENIFSLDGAPHDWLFPQMAGVVHHGGAGTTAAALRAGVPTTIVAHMADQPYWGRRTVELGVAPTFIPRHKLSVDTLAEAITAMVTDDGIKQRAADLGKKIQAENGVENAVKALGEMIGGPGQASAAAD